MQPTRLAVWIFAASVILALLCLVIPGFWFFWLSFLAIFVTITAADGLLGIRLKALSADLQLEGPLLVHHQHQAKILWTSPGTRMPRLRLKLTHSEHLEVMDWPDSLKLPRGLSELAFHIRPTRRGVGKIDSLWVSSVGPLGLLQKQIRIRWARDFNIIVNLNLVSRQVLQLRTTHALQHGSRIEVHLGDGSEFDQLVEYVPGNDTRRMDWKASARNYKLLCKRMRAERNREVMVVIDTGRLMAEPLSNVPRLDHAIHAGLTLAYVSLALGDRVGLAAFERRLTHYTRPVSGISAFQALSETAARMHYSTHETNYTLGLMELSQQLTRRALIVVMTDIVDVIASQLLVDNLGRLGLRHQVLFVSLADPYLEQLWQHEPDGTHALHQAAVAYKLRSQRHEVIHRLRRLGIHCLDCLPQDLSPMMIDHYLQLKRREAF